jgi:hypothetical protein
LQAEFTDGKSDEEAISCQPGGADRDPFSLCLHGEMKSLVANALGDLEEKERQVVTLVLPGRTYHEGSGRGAWGGRIASVADSLSCARALARQTGGIPAFPVENFRDTGHTGLFSRCERVEKILT